MTRILTRTEVFTSSRFEGSETTADLLTWRIVIHRLPDGWRWLLAFNSQLTSDYLFLSLYTISHMDIVSDYLLLFLFLSLSQLVLGPKVKATGVRASCAQTLMPIIAVSWIEMLALFTDWDTIFLFSSLFANLVNFFLYFWNFFQLFP